ncbi:hypothetical protein J5N97_023628 [Dioscorea zingiberensis]|uniref:Uncharacterized protein n=1 Tax=Dioscorea zingiberensis TaxID=325984 RepID=A0A9D5C574_9LILI|nr:hypothetical protein J5N97_023628 [Dioscorea zingiberensis]
MAGRRPSPNAKSRWRRNSSSDDDSDSNYDLELFRRSNTDVNKSSRFPRISTGNEEMEKKKKKKKKEKSAAMAMGASRLPDDAADLKGKLETLVFVSREMERLKTCMEKYKIDCVDVSQSLEKVCALRRSLLEFSSQGQPRLPSEHLERLLSQFKLANRQVLISVNKHATTVMTNDEMNEVVRSALLGDFDENNYFITNRLIDSLKQANKKAAAASHLY